MQPEQIFVLDVSTISYTEQVCAAALQGLVNRVEARIFLDFGIYDDPQARRTNEIFLDDDIWFNKFREILSNQDRHNLTYYRDAHGLAVIEVESLDQLIRQFRGSLNGCVVWDTDLPDTVNVAIMLAAQEGLLAVNANLLPQAESQNLHVVHDLRGRWQNRLDLTQWTYENLFNKCKPGKVACIEPGWQRPEFIDYVVREKILTYNLSSQHKGLAQNLLLLLAFGPAWLRELIFALSLDGLIRNLAVRLLGRSSLEIRLNNRIQQNIKAESYPTIFGWHTKRDDELTFMLLLSANGLRLVPSHLAANFSFHAAVTPLNIKPAVAETEAPPALDPQGTYLTFTLSDGDQLMMMSTGELGSWRSTQRGQIPFNWEVQPLLIELAPALLEKFRTQATPNDCLIAGPSGAGYIIPPLAPHPERYLQETNRICRLAGIQVITSYVADPPKRVLFQLGKNSQGIIGYLSGYAVLGRAPQMLLQDSVFIANQVPTVNQLWDNADKLLESIREIANHPTSQRPRFIGVHLFAYRTSYDDVVKFVSSINNPHIHVVRADTFLKLAKQHLQK